MANLITIARFPLLAVIVILLYAGPTARLIAAVLIGISILMDMADGMVARSRKEESLLGSVLDIMADRSVELVMWVCFAHLQLIPVAIPVIYVIRGVVVDSLRNIHVGEGTAPFKTMKSKLGRWLVGSPPMRTSYAISKFISFAGLAVTNALFAYADAGRVSIALAHDFRTVFAALSWVSVAFCLARGLPVIIEQLGALRQPSRESQVQ